MKEHIAMEAFGHVGTIDIINIKYENNDLNIDWNRVVDINDSLSNDVELVEFNWKSINSIASRDIQNSFKKTIKRSSVSVKKKNETNNFVHSVITCVTAYQKEKKKKSIPVSANGRYYSKDKKLFVNFLWDFPHVNLEKVHKNLRKYKPNTTLHSSAEIETLIERASKEELKEVLRPSEYIHILPYARDKRKTKIPNPFDFVAKIK